MNTLLIESNRAIANSLIDDSLESNVNIVDTRHEAIGNNARWSTIIESGLELKPGDQISMESCALNVKGAGSDNFMTFTGTTEAQLADGSFKTDNKAKLKVAYYISNNIQSNIPLPLGSATITDSRTLFSHDYGMPDLTGKQIWGVNFIDQVYPAKPTQEYMRYSAFNDGWSLNKNGYFFDGIASSDGSDMVLPAFPAGTQNLQKKTMNEVMGYMAWNQNVPIYGLTGCSFGQNNTDKDSTYNFNIENKDKTSFRVNQPENTSPTPPVEFKAGGASPYYIQNKGIINNNTLTRSLNGGLNSNNGIYYASHRNTITNTFPSDLNNFSTIADNYDDLCAIPAVTFKGTYCNYKPNPTRLYCTDYTDGQKTNFGPYYNPVYNNLVEGLPTSTTIDLRTTGRDEHYFHLLESEISLDLGKGNLAPQRVAELITDQMKERQPDMSDPKNAVGIGAEVYLTFPDNLGANNQEVPLNPEYFEVIKDKIAQISSKCYFNYPTMAGLCWNSKTIYPKSNDKRGWSVCETEQSSETGVSSTRRMTGDDYDKDQAYNKFYQIMLTGNPFEWETVCRIHPMLQIAPFVAPEVGSTFDYTKYSIMAGFNAGFPVTRILPGGATTTYQIGNLGCFPCITSDGLNYNITEQEDYAFKAMWYEGTASVSNSQVGGAGPNNYDINALRCSQSCVYDLPKKREVANIQEYNIIPTNIIFDGQVLLSIWNEQYEKIKKHSETTGTDTLKSQSDSFFNSTFVDWIIGRIDDMYSYPENKSSNDIAIYETGSPVIQLTPTPHRDGTPVFLPNIYQTYRLYNDHPEEGGSSTADTATNANEIKDLLVSFTKTSGPNTFTGSYMMRNMRVGYADKDFNNYTTEKNPSSLYNVGNAPVNTFDPTASGNDSKYFGLPCYSTYGKDFIQDEGDYKTAYEKGCRRTIECFRYLPQGVNYNYRQAYNRAIRFGTTAMEDQFTTRPDNFSLQQIKDLWDKITDLNNGKGIGLIPIFYKVLPDGVTNKHLLEVPFLGVVAKNQPNSNMPRPRLGEYFMLGSTPSLSQNNLSFPATTQQTNLQIRSNENPINKPQQIETQYITNFCGIQNFRPCINDPTSSSNPQDIVTSLRTPFNEEQNKLILSNGGKQLSNGVMVGANDPLCSYDTTFNRFSFGNLHTQLFKGNGVFQLGSFGPNTNPGEIEKVVNAQTASFSQQVQLPAGYFQKIDDDTTPWFVFQSTLDKYIPGRLTVGGQGLKPIQIQSIEGNIINQSFSSLTNGPGVDENGDDAQPGDEITNNFEPAGMSKYYRDGSTSGGHTVFMGNPLYMAPYNGVQFRLRLLNSETALDFFTEQTFLYPPTLRPYAYIKGNSEPYLFNSAQSGIGITGLSIPKTNDTDIVLGSVDYSLFEGSMFSKLGFSLNQFRPIFSQVQTKFNHTLFNKYLGKDQSAYKAFQNMVYPVTTNSINTTSSLPGAVNGFGTGSEDSDKSIPNVAMPMFNLGEAVVPSATTATSDFIIAKDLPTKLSFPYLVLRSNISTPCATQYMGGPNGSQLLPAVSYLMTSYSSDDFFYNYRSDLVFTVDRPFVLTDLISSIHYPNGQLATDVLGENSAVIYRIDFAKTEPQENSDKK